MKIKKLKMDDKMVWVFMCPGCGIIVCPERYSHTWYLFSVFDDDLIGKEIKIVKVYKPKHPYDIFYNYKGWDLIWERNELKVGDKVKIVDSDLISGLVGVIRNIDKFNKKQPLDIEVNLTNDTYMHYYCNYNNVIKIQE